MNWIEWAHRDLVLSHTVRSSFYVSVPLQSEDFLNIHMMVCDCGYSQHSPTATDSTRQITGFLNMPGNLNMKYISYK